MKRKFSYENNEYYHIYNRGVDKRNIFINKSDYKRFLSILKVFNSTEPFKNIKRPIVQDRILHISSTVKLVDIDEYCLMPNHFHLLVRQLEDGGISKFLQRVGIGYTMYFNTKYNRDGVLFQGGHKSKHVDNEPYLYWLRSYIHLNPLDIYLKNWKEKGVPKSKLSKSIGFLNNYQWTSCKDYNTYKGDLNEWQSIPDWQE